MQTRCGAFKKNKMRSIITLIVFICSYQIGLSQVHWLINPDTRTNCDIIKTGKFINKVSNESSTPGYYIVFEDGYATEFIDDGKFYLKSKIDFISDCEYKSTVVEVTIPNYNLKPGTVIHTEVIETIIADNLIKIRSTLEGNSYFFVLQKIE